MPRPSRLAALAIALTVPGLTVPGLAASSPMAAGPAPADPLSGMRTGVQPGCAVWVLEPAGERFDAAGFADLEAGVPITPRTRFLIASASKQFTALAVLTLVDQGRLRLDAPAARLLPEMAGALQGATVRQLLNQTAGVRDHTALMALAGIERLGEVAPGAILTMMRGLESGNFPPGERARYSNGNYLMLALIVERVSGQSLEAYATATLFAPLGMADTRFHADAPMAHGYARAGGGWRVADDQPALAGSGGLVTTVEDLARFDAAFRAGGGPLTDAVRATLVEPGRLADGAVALLTEFGTPYGAGLGLERRDGAVWLSHDGGSEGFRAEYLRQAAEPRGAAVLCNRTDIDPSAIARALLRIAEPAPATPPPPSPPAPSPPRPPRPAASPTDLAPLTGRWLSPETGIAYEIRTTDDGLQTTISSPLAREPVVEDWGGLRIGESGEITTGPLRLKARGEGLSVSFGRRVETLMFRRAPALSK